MFQLRGQMLSRLLMFPKRLVGRAQRVLARLRNHIVLSGLKGIIHVGANLAQEREHYARHHLNVLWIEPIPWIFNDLQNAIIGYSGQRALQYLVLDQDDVTRTLHVANNDGASSSVLEMALHRDMWPGVHFVKDIEIVAHKLDTIVERERIDLRDYDGLVLDTQGSELLVLKGADRVLQQMRFVKVEVADFKAYANCPKPQDIADFLKAYGFREWRRVPFAWHGEGGRYYDITYLKN
jgi:FkbM family methyltransferase